MSYIGNTPTTQAFTPAVDYFSGNASTTAFTLSRPVASVAQVQVVVNNVAQNPSSAYTISSNTITFTSAPSSGTNNIYVYYTSPITQVIAPSQGSVNTTSLGNITNLASGNSSLTLQTGSGNTTAVTIDTSQNVGIGTTSPATKLNVNTSATSDGLSIGTSGTVYTKITSSGTDSNIIATNAFAVQTNGSERMRIDSSGNLLVGGTSVVYYSHILSTFNGASQFGFVANETSGNANSGFHGFTVSGTAIGSITRVSTTNAVAFNTTSDERLKSNITDAQPVLEKLMNVKVRQYDWTEGQVHQDYGFIAQELEPTLSGIVTKGKTDEDMWQLDYAKLTPHLVKAIQELKAINDQQAETINALTARVAALENK